MVPYSPGGPADALARIITEPFGQEMRQTVIVENLGGAGGALGAQKVLTQPADGHYLLQASPNEVILAPALNPAIKLRADDFRLVHPIARGVLVLVTRQGLDARSADEIVALAKQRGGNTLSYGSVGIGTLNHLIMEDIQRAAGVQFTHVPYKGSSPLLQDLAGGQIDVAVLVFSASLGGLADKGVINVVGQLGEQRSELLPNVPTMGEGKALKTLSYTTWSGVMVSKDTPDATVQQLNKILAGVMQQKRVRDLLAAQTLEAVEPMPLENVTKFFHSEIESYRTMLGAIDVKLK